MPMKVRWGKAVDADCSFFIDEMSDCSFTIASNKKELKQLITSDADVVSYENTGVLPQRQRHSQRLGS
jgi:hypothetical protein